MIEYITVRTFYEEVKDRLKLQLLTSENGFSRRITKSDTHRPGLALAGFVDLFTYDCIQVLGNTENQYLASMSDDKSTRSIERLLEFEIPCLVVTHGNRLPDYALEAATRRYI
jgi:HPr kinase/phosphorylase